MTAQQEKRASGRTTGEVVAHEHATGHDTEPTTVRPPEAETRKFDFTGFARIRTGWRGDDLAALERVEYEVEDALFAHFKSLYRTRQLVWWQVREPLVNSEGEMRLDRHGMQRWRRYPKDHPDAGDFIEDWSNISDGFRIKLVDKIINYLFDWKATAENLRAESLYARGQYEEMFAAGFESLPPITATRPTVDDREARAKMAAAEERYFALYVTQLSRRADVLVSSMEKLEQRQKDLLPQR